MIKRAFVVLGFWLGLGAQATELNSTLYIFRQSHFDNCLSQIDKAHAQGNSKVNIVFTVYFLGLPQSNRIESLCYQNEAGCAPIDAAVAASIQVGFESCIQKAFDRGMDVAYLPHIDYGGEVEYSYWRNNLNFDPYQDYDGASYYAAAIRPVIGALKNIYRNPQYRNKSFDFAMAGEMGSSVFHHAESYRRLLREIKTKLGSSPVKTGVSLNHNLVGAAGQRYTAGQLRSVQSLLNESDFVGISAYTPLVFANLSRAEIYKNVTNFEAELATYGLSLGCKQDVHLSEIAIGGGTVLNNGIKAGTVEEAASAPWAGVGAYSLQMSPWETEDFRALRKKFYDSVLDLLSGPAAGEKKITAAFLWSLGSWDPQGLWVPEYKDDIISGAIRAHNASH